MSSTRTIVALSAVAVVGALAGCSSPPGEAYVDTSVGELISSQPGVYELHSTVENPIAIPTQGENWVVLRQGKDMIIAGGDTLEARLEAVKGQAFSIIGRRMGQPKIWFAVDGIVQDEKLVASIGQLAEKIFPSYEEYDPALVEPFEVVDIAEFDFDKERNIRKNLLDKDVRVVGALARIETEEGGVQWLVEGPNMKIELSPVGPNLQHFLTLASREGSPFVGYGKLISIRDWNDGTDTDRESSMIVGAFHTQLYRYSRDIIVRNVLPGS